MKTGSRDGLYLAAQGGHNAESHNHDDVGNFIVYANGKPVLIDLGVETYTAKTFSKQRYDIWTMQSAYHNCPTINGVMQSAGRQFAAERVGYRADVNAAEFPSSWRVPILARRVSRALCTHCASTAGGTLPK